MACGSPMLSVPCLRVPGGTNKPIYVSIERYKGSTEIMRTGRWVLDDMIAV